MIKLTMTDFFKSLWKAILKFASFIFKSLFQKQIKQLVNETLSQVQPTHDQEIIFDNSSIRIDLSLGEDTREAIMWYLHEVTKDCKMTPELKKLFYLISTVSIDVLIPIKDDLLAQFNEMFLDSTSE